MTNDPRYLGLATGAVVGQAEGGENEGGGEVVGAADAEADAIRAGAEDSDDLRGATRDSDGVPVGEADAEADAQRAGADPDER